MGDIRHQDIGLILQKIYNSEIDVAIGWNWDGGLVYSITNTPYPLEMIYETTWTGETDFAKGMALLVKDVVQKYPLSDFAKWIKGDFQRNKYEQNSIRCPFCEEQGFDLIGLAHHLPCDEMNKIPKAF